MKSLINLLVLLIFSIQISGQITIDNNTLPEIGEVLTYALFDNYPDTTFKKKGENQLWKFKDFEIADTSEEVYAAIWDSELTDTIPAANLYLELDGLTAYGTRNENAIEILAINNPDLTGMGSMLSILARPYTLRQTPIVYGEKYSDEFDVEIVFGTEFIPGIDSIDLGIPGATISSFVATISNFRSEEVIGWGNLSLDGEEHEVLQVLETDSTGIAIAVVLDVFGFPLTLDLADLLGDMGGGEFGFGNEINETYRFIGADQKYSLAEFSETEVIDSLGVVIGTEVSGRLGLESMLISTRDLLSSSDLSLYPNPVSEVIYLEHSSTYTPNSVIRIYDSNGQLIAQHKYHSGNQAIPIAQLVPGHYYLQLTDGSNVLTKKFIKN